MGVLWRMAGLPGDAPCDPKAETAALARNALVASAGWFLAVGRLTGEEYAALTAIERAAMIAAAERNAARAALMQARALAGGKGAAEVMALVDEREAESMLLDTIPERGGKR